MHHTERGNRRMELVEECAYARQWLESMIDQCALQEQRLAKRVNRLFPVSDAHDSSAAKEDADAAKLANKLIDDLNAISAAMSKVCKPE